MSGQPFKTIVQSGERGRALINLPFDPVVAWGKQKRHYVKGTINGVAFTGWLDVRDEQYSLPLDKTLRDSTGIMVGDLVSVVMEADSPETSDVPPDLAEALQGEPAAKTFFESLSAFYQNAYIEWMTSADRNSIREARVIEIVSALKAQKKQR